MLVAPGGEDRDQNARDKGRDNGREDSDHTPNDRPERRGAKGFRMQTGRAIPRPLQAVGSALS